MFHKFVLFLCFIIGILAQQQPRREIQTIIIQFAQPLSEWVGFNKSALQVAYECNLNTSQHSLLDFHRQLAQKGQSFTRQHVELIKKVFQSNQSVRAFFKCMIDKRNTQNLFFKETKKLKYIAQFIKQYGRISQQMFYENDKPIDKGYRLGRFFRAFFQYYYQHVLYPAETASTKLIRAITPKTDLFLHEDISRCLSVQTAGKISQNLQNLGIYNIYINIPQAFNALKYLKLKQTCKSQKYLRMVSQVHGRLQKLDMFKIMYHEYNPWVQIAAEKYGNRQIQYVGEIFARIFNNVQHYREISEIEEM